jgi:hypothetical protein
MSSDFSIWRLASLRDNWPLEQPMKWYASATMSRPTRVWYRRLTIEISILPAIDM